jgi:L-ascorbate metabolism protein UlaG (beta-lactamase superfamily)
MMRNPTTEMPHPRSKQLSERRFASSIVIATLAAVPLTAQSGKAAMQQDPACQSLTPVSAGGPAPKSADTVVVRWLGMMNYELAYRDQVFLLNAYFDRLPHSHPIGVVPADIRNATAIFVGHAHFDHVADAPSIAKRISAPIVGAPFGDELAAKAGLPAKQYKVAMPGEVLRYSGVTVEVIRGSHTDQASLAPSGFFEKQNAALREASLDKPLTDEERKQADAIRSRGSTDPRINTEGVLNFLFTFGNGFRVMLIDSAGKVTDAQRAVAQKTPSVDVAMIPYVGFEAGIRTVVDYVKLLQPSVVFLGAHDGAGTMNWASNYPPALAIRDASPKTRTLDVIYRTPVCFNTASKEMTIGW